ncbi:MAG: hypothetical protein ACK5ZJ_11015, partial [Acidobacteriota bacterium]
SAAWFAHSRLVENESRELDLIWYVVGSLDDQARHLSPSKLRQFFASTPSAGIPAASMLRSTSLSD